MPKAIATSNGNGLFLSTTLASHIKQKSLGLGEVEKMDKGTFRICLSPSVCRCTHLFECLVVVSLGGVSGSPGDSQSVLALQYKENNCKIQETSSLVGLSILQSPCGMAQLEFMFVSERVFECVLTTTVTQYIFICKHV